MFSKPGLFNRNDSTARKESPTASSSIAKPVIQTPGTSPARNPGGNNVGTLKSAPGYSVPEANGSAANNPADPSLASEAGEKGNDTPMGARLIVGPDVKLKGAEILDCDTLVVEGRVEATMDSRVIRIAENGSFSGKVSIDIAEIHGTFEGELTARSQLIIHSTGRVSGKVRYGKLVADEGCELCGDINTLTASPASREKSAAEPFLALSAAAG